MIRMMMIRIRRMMMKKKGRMQFSEHQRMVVVVGSIRTRMGNEKK